MGWFIFEAAAIGAAWLGMLAAFYSMRRMRRALVGLNKAYDHLMEHPRMVCTREGHDWTADVHPDDATLHIIQMCLRCEERLGMRIGSTPNVRFAPEHVEIVGDDTDGF